LIIRVIYLSSLIGAVSFIIVEVNDLPAPQILPTTWAMRHCDHGLCWCDFRKRRKTSLHTVHSGITGHRTSLFLATYIW